MSNRIVIQTTQNQVNVYKGDLNLVGDTSTVVNQEAPSGSINGTNAVFTLTHVPVNLVLVVVNGLIQREGASYDYTRSGAIITFTNSSKPQPGDFIVVTYSYQA